MASAYVADAQSSLTHESAAMLRSAFVLFSLAIVFACGTTEAVEISGWGTFINPADDCDIEVAEGKVKFVLPETRHDLWYGGKVVENRFNAPRILQEVEGDFYVIVRVTANWKEGISEGGYNGAGLVIWDSEKQYLRHERNRFLNPAQTSKEYSYSTPLYDHNDHRVFYNSTADDLYQGNSSWMQIVRSGAYFITSFSHDRKTWTRTGVVATEFPDTVQVGIIAINSTGREFTVEFDDFLIEKK